MVPRRWHSFATVKEATTSLTAKTRSNVHQRCLSYHVEPVKWLVFPLLSSGLKAVDTNIPAYALPRVIYGFAFSAVFGFDAKTLDRNWVTPWVTNEGAQVLLPNWDLILPAIDQIFN
jgi:hypothetical protein